MANRFYTILPNLLTDPTPPGLSSDGAMTPHRRGGPLWPPFPMLGFYSHLPVHPAPPPQPPSARPSGRRVLSCEHAARPEALLGDWHCGDPHRCLISPIHRNPVGIPDRTWLFVTPSTYSPLRILFVLRPRLRCPRRRLERTLGPRRRLSHGSLSRFSKVGSKGKSDLGHRGPCLRAATYRIRNT